MRICLKSQTPWAGSPYTTSDSCLQRSTMGPTTKTHTVPHPNTGINPTKIRKMASSRTNAWHLQCRGSPPCGQKRNPSLKNILWSPMPNPEAITSVSQMSNSPSPAQLALQLPVKQPAGPAPNQCPVTADVP